MSFGSDIARAAAEGIARVAFGAAVAACLAVLGWASQVHSLNGIIEEQAAETQRLQSAAGNPGCAWAKQTLENLAARGAGVKAPVER